MMTFKTVQIYFLSTDPKCIFNNNFPILKFPDIYKLWTHFKLESLCVFMKLACFPMYLIIINHYISRHSNTFYIISSPNKYKTF